MIPSPKVRSRFFSTFLSLLFLSLAVMGQSYPDPLPGRLVHDFAQILPDGREAQLERRLRSLNDTTSIQISIVTLSSTDGDDIAIYNTELAHRWGVGQADTDNGVQILIAAEDRKVNITTGYGAQEYITDALSKRIIENYMLPEFRKGDYSAGLDAAITIMDDILQGKYTAEGLKSAPNRGKKALPGSLFILLAILLMFWWNRGGRGGGGGRRRRRSVGEDIATAILLSSLGRNRHHGGFGSGGFGGGGFGGGGGGFGGFGGGGFGGGGASGSW